MQQSSIDFFIVGYPRSGTTLAATLLSRHNEIYIPAETQFFRKFYPVIKDSTEPDEIYDKFIHDNRLKDIGIDNGAAKKIILENKTPEENSLLLARLLRHQAESENKSIVGEKSPGHILYYSDILKSHPKTKFIYVMRDGRDCVFSNIKESWTFKNPLKHASEWNYYINHYKELKNLIPENVKLVRYEDLIDSPEIEIESIMQFLNVNFEHGQIDNKEATNVIPEWEKAWKQKASETPDKNNKYKWKTHIDQKLVNELTIIMKDNLSEFNYNTSNLDRVSHIEKLLTTLKYFIFQPHVYPIIKLAAKTKFYSIYKKLRCQ